MGNANEPAQSTLIKLSNQVVKDRERIPLKVERMKEANQVCCWMPRKTPLLDLMVDYTRRFGIAFNSVGFLYDDDLINQVSTPDSLEMEDGDTIHVIGGDPLTATGAIQSTLISLPRDCDENPIVLKVQDLITDGHIFYRIDRNAPLHNLMLDYCDRICVLLEHMRFFHSAKFIKLNETAEDLKIKDGNVVILGIQTRFG